MREGCGLVSNYEPGVDHGVGGRRRGREKRREERPEGRAGHGIVGTGGGDPEGDGIAVRLKALSLEEVSEACEEVMRWERNMIRGCLVGEVLRGLDVSRGDRQQGRGLQGVPVKEPGRDVIKDDGELVWVEESDGVVLANCRDNLCDGGDKIGGVGKKGGGAKCGEAKCAYGGTWNKGVDALAEGR